jgi:hypothetical protein
VLCFVDFANAAQAAVSMEALQGKIYSVNPNHSPVFIHEIRLVALSLVATTLVLKLTALTTQCATLVTSAPIWHEYLVLDTGLF